MQDIIFFFLLGLGIGSLYAMLGAGLVVVFKGSGVLNFAHGAMAMFGAFTFSELRQNGGIQLPWFDILPGDWNLPVEVSFSDEGLGFVVSFLGALAMAVAIGLAVHFLVFRPLRNAAPLGKVIGSVGVLLYLQGVALLNFGASFRQPESVLPDEPINNFLGLDKVYPRNALYSVVIALAIGAVLWAVYRFTRFGLATRAAAGNEKGAVLLGYSPERLAAANWVIASVLATVAAIIVGPIQGTLTPVGLTAVVVPALGAALIGGLRSIPVAVLGGLLLGGIQAVFGFWAGQDWAPDFLSLAAVRDAVPFIAIVLVLFLRGKSLPLRGTVEEKRLPLSPTPRRVIPHMIVWSAVVIVLAFWFPNLDGPFAFALTTSLVGALLALSTVVITGYIGQISLAQLSLAGVAAFFTSRMLSDGSITTINPFPVSGPDLPWPVAGVLGIVAAVVVGVVLGLPALRIRGVQLAVVTLAFAISLQTLYLENENLTALRAGAPAAFPTPFFFGLDIGSVGDGGLTDSPAFTIFCLVVLLACVGFVANLRRGGTGRRFLAVRANERAAAAAGVDVAPTKLLAFAVAAGLAGVSGVMFGFQQTNVSSASFIYGLGLASLAFAYLGGITSINGAIVGGMLVPAGMITVTSNYFFHETNVEAYAPALGGLGMIVTAILHPEGIAPFFQPLMRHAGTWLTTARGPEWASFARRFVPTMVLGAVLGAIIWPLRVDSYSWFWMPLLGAFLALFVRSIGRRIYFAVTGRTDPHDPHAAHGIESPPMTVPVGPQPSEGTVHARTARAEPEEVGT